MTAEDFKAICKIKEQQGEGVKVALLDTGVDRHHPYFLGQHLEWRDFCNPVAGNGLDNDGHGTHCAGIIKQVAPGSTLLSGRTLTQSGLFTYGALVDGLAWAFHEGSDIVCVCSGERQPDSDLDKCLSEAQHSAIVVAAIGNRGLRGSEAGCYPARCPGVIAVGATDVSGFIAAFTDLPDGHDVFCIPGVNWMSATLNGGFRAASGTSTSAAAFAGLLALRLCKARRDGGDSSPASVRERLMKSSAKVQSNNESYWKVDPVRFLAD